MVNVIKFLVIVCLSTGLLTGCKQNISDIFAAIQGKSKIYGNSYTVRAGDSLTSIASRSGVNQKQLIIINQLKAPYKLLAGQKLRLKSLPTINKLITQQNNVAKSKTQHNNLDKQAQPKVYAVNNKCNSSATTSGAKVVILTTANATNNSATNNSATNTNTTNNSATNNSATNNSATNTNTTNNSATTSGATTTGATTSGVNTSNAHAHKQRSSIPALPKTSWIWPAKGPILGNFTNGKMKKNGLDIGGVKGAAVYAAGNGSVVYSGNGLRGYGNLIIIKHNNNFLSAYAHNSENIVKEGEMVGIGQMIAKMGDTGADKVMLHFEIRYNGKPLDPLILLPRKK